MIIFLVLLLITVLIIGLTIHFSRLIVYPKQLSHRETLDYEMNSNSYDPSIFDSLISKDINIRSYLGYNLKGKVYLQKSPSRFIIFCHGITNNYESMMKYAQVYIKNGYSILLYDQRNHGYSERNYSSLGVFEKKDAKCCVDYIMKRYNPSIIGVHGESLGAATAMQLAAIDKRINFCVEDCGYSNAFELMKYRALLDYNKVLSLLTYSADLYLKIFYKFSLKEASIIHDINDIKCPILFIHGEDDDYVPYYMVSELYDTFEGQKMKYTVPEAKHAKSYITNSVLYNEQVDMFLKRYT